MVHAIDLTAFSVVVNPDVSGIAPNPLDLFPAVLADNGLGISQVRAQHEELLLRVDGALEAGNRWDNSLLTRHTIYYQ